MKIGAKPQKKLPKASVHCWGILKENDGSLVIAVHHREAEAQRHAAWASKTFMGTYTAVPVVVSITTESSQ